MALPLELTRGTSRDFHLQINNSDGTPTEGFFAGTEPLSAKVWEGGEESVLLSPSVSWVSGPAGTYVVRFNDHDTVNWDIGQYRMQTYAIVSGPRTIKVGDVTINIAQSPGTGTPLPVYCQYSDMLYYAPWLPSLSSSQSDETGFAQQRNAARTWIENVIQRHYRQSVGSNMVTFGNSVPGMWPMRTGGISPWLQKQLDDDLLMVSPPRRVVEITAKYAIALVLQSQMPGSGADKNAYTQRGRWFFAEAENLVKGYTAEIDINNDGYSDITIECGLIDVMQGG